MKTGILYITAAAFLTGCATIVSGTSQSIAITTPKVDGAECKLTDSKGGQWYLADTPGSVTVRKGDGPMTIICSKDGYEKGTTLFEEEIAGSTLGNIILGGGIGIFVDAASGAAQKYPDQAIVWMKPAQWKSEEQKIAWLEEKKEYEEKIAAEIKEKQEDSRTQKKKN